MKEYSGLMKSDTGLDPTTIAKSSLEMASFANLLITLEKYSCGV